VDYGGLSWRGYVGVVTTLFRYIRLQPDRTVALVCGPEIMMRYVVRELETRGLASDSIHLSMERNMKCAVGFCGHCQFGPHFICKDGPSSPIPRCGRGWINMSSNGKKKPRIAVFKFASCDGCQLSLLDAEEQLLDVVGAVDLAYFPEASRNMGKGPYDIGLVEGSITPTTTPSASSRSAVSAAPWSPSAPAPPPAASRRCAIGRTSPSSSAMFTPRPITSARSRCPRPWPSTSRWISSCAAAPSTNCN